jgi:HEAT repeat protein
MKKRVGMVLGAVLLVGLAVIMLIPTSRYLLSGWLTREAFFQGKPTTYWVSALKGDEQAFGRRDVSRDVGKELREGGAAAVPVLVEMLQNDDKNVRFQALLALKLIHPEDPSVPPALSEFLAKEADVSRRGLALATLQEMNVQLARTALIDALQRNPKDEWAASSLGAMGPEARDAVPVLRAALAEDPFSFSVAQALWRIDRQASPPILLALAFERPQDPGNLALVREIGVQARDAIPGLVESLVSPRAEVRARAALVLGQLKEVAAEEAVIRALTRALADEAVGVRVRAAEALAVLRPAGANDTDGLLAGLKDADSAKRNQAAAALGRTRPDARIVQALIDVLKDQAVEVRQSAMLALARMGPAARSAVAALTEAVRDEHVCLWAVSALARIGPAARAAVPVLLEATSSQNPDIRMAAFQSLKLIDPSATGVKLPGRSFRRGNSSADTRKQSGSPK